VKAQWEGWGGGGERRGERCGERCGEGCGERCGEGYGEVQEVVRIFQEELSRG